jgi:hypothetical protein
VVARFRPKWNSLDANNARAFNILVHLPAKRAPVRVNKALQTRPWRIGTDSTGRNSDMHGFVAFALAMQNIGIATMHMRQ